MRAITVSVDYGDYLALTLPLNRHHFEEFWMVTTPDDLVTQEIAQDYECDLFITESFYDDGAKFNKWKALDEGFKVMGREGWLANIDADIIWPNSISREGYDDETKLYSPFRYMYIPVRVHSQVIIPTEDCWSKFRLERDQRFLGFTQIFHADNPVLQSEYWFPQHLKSASVGDVYFQDKWKMEDRVRLPWNVLHLGEAAKNWVGRATTRMDGSIPEGAEEKMKMCAELVKQAKEHRLRS